MPQTVEREKKPGAHSPWSELAGRWSARHSYLLLAAATLVCLLPFINTAFQVDDPLFIWAAQQISRHPLNPYGFQLVWDTKLVSMSEVTKNPPLASYYGALIGSLTGWSETAFHLTFLVPALAVALGSYRLARRLTGSPLIAAAATLLTPGVLVSASSIMCDTMMLALWIWAVIFWIEGMEPAKPLYFASSALLIAAAGLTKYFGVALIPLLLAYSIYRKRQLGSWAAYLLIPIAVFAAYQLWTQALYGQGLLLNAAEFSRSQRAESGPPSVLVNGLMAASFTGGCALIAVLAAPLLWRGKQCTAGVGLAIVAGLALSRGWLRLGYSPQADQVAAALHQRWLVVGLQLGLCIAGGISVLALAVADFWRRRDEASVLLLLWVFGTFVFAGFLNWTINARSILPLIPAVGILLGRRVDSVKNGKMIAALTLAVLVSGSLSIWITAANAAWANSAREAAGVIREKTNGGIHPAWFEGHWGFQYYMQLHGTHPVDFTHSKLSAGDLLVVPQNAAETYKLKKKFMASAQLLEIPIATDVTTMRWELGAGFYSSSWGPLPFAVGEVPAEQYYLFRVGTIGDEDPWEDPMKASY